MTLPSDYLESVKEELYNIIRALRSGNLIDAYEATVQAQNQVQHSLDEIKKVKA